ncbi:hypothetical protein LTR91_023667 [Friedmanniomyces endolithicus]|uniref:Uncharacterized protein n=1 Tax=Friedmanniomyces endolithicus TaxID=329885 RepID=A0AAN6K3T0_9PEZI|nr:hypothetical protein LTS01_024308 [Friedmanniomyces endolithicus]KAK0953766.1 hypothetical protein LTR91_023667 [Friedmanniomyces endolithicus]KAK1022921.1 hypothetical protein LTS16_025328 [Friedmanniomyces endolithicus]
MGLPASDKQRTDLLWRQRRASQPSFARPTQASQRRGMELLTPPASAHSTQPQRSRPSSPIPRPPSSTSGRSITTRSSAVNSGRAKQRTPRVTDKDFRLTTLNPHGIEIVEDPTLYDFRGPYRHFETEATGQERKSKDELVSWYQTRSGLEDAPIWLSLLPEDEAKFAFYGKLAFFKQDVAHIPRSSARKRSAYCKMEWAPQPDSDILRCPPMVSHVTSLAASGRNEAPFTFNHKPDCTFWLPMVQFNPVYRRAMPRLTFMVPKAEVVGPYLTIEFKKADQDMASAVNQLAASAALILFNRVTLRIRRLNEYSLQREQCSFLSHLEGLKHYGIALAAQYANIHVIKPRFEATGKARDGQNGAFDVASVWRGCRVRLLVSLDLTREEDVLEMLC